MSTSENDSVSSIGSFFSEGCPAADSYFYEQRNILYEINRAKGGRRGTTAYFNKKSKRQVGDDECLVLEKNTEGQRLFPRSQSYRNRKSQRSQGRISINM
jgi:hypothetical protein